MPVEDAEYYLRVIADWVMGDEYRSTKRSDAAWAILRPQITEGEAAALLGIAEKIHKAVDAACPP